MGICVSRWEDWGTGEETCLSPHSMWWYLDIKLAPEPVLPLWSLEQWLPFLVFSSSDFPMSPLSSSFFWVSTSNFLFPPWVVVVVVGVPLWNCFVKLLIVQGYPWLDHYLDSPKELRVLEGLLEPGPRAAFVEISPLIKQLISLLRAVLVPSPVLGTVNTKNTRDMAPGFQEMTVETAFKSELCAGSVFNWISKDT